ncbi:hypothetical protein CDL12_11407 [Handroanthus impetiginosus]|uniref:Uncharacterized protein n=1 Tax=Handroanthus impetiginosus TaxID=429701 RepID=A0A2G9HEK5_9LAMI|nr:hypothetical protein CDL12_11407 [Handroanthus impetiginosus]
MPRCKQQLREVFTKQESNLMISSKISYKSRTQLKSTFLVPLDKLKNLTHDQIILIPFKTYISKHTQTLTVRILKNFILIQIGNKVHKFHAVNKVRMHDFHNSMSRIALPVKF